MGGWEDEGKCEGTWWFLPFGVGGVVDLVELSLLLALLETTSRQTEDGSAMAGN